MAGGSAGALTATLTATDVDFYKATQLALDICDDLGIWERSEGLQGVWGQTIVDWLEELLPEDAAAKVQKHELTLLVTKIPSFQKERITDFLDRKDLIHCNRASVHIPWFLDGKLTNEFRGRRYIDGSFWVDPDLFLPNRPDPPTIVLDHTLDPVLKDKTLFDAVALVEPKGIWGLLEQGKAYARNMDEETDLFRIIPKKATRAKECIDQV
eukprot:CAMPEP_0198148946 /NCGR_PEP_ID=MMETSP1443-20131203/44325_1 /TAXON_ID=186043 /ORGANISM="Entomoneis sp., Strain CCMP2396" /LENGTH=210 /DNA_ID=CAMNT_0043813823 /DNA_START=229 /DNA_END=861 /DNA_ORIENTATION=+